MLSHRIDYWVIGNFEPCSKDAPYLTLMGQWCLLWGPQEYVQLEFLSHNKFALPFFLDFSNDSYRCITETLDHLLSTSMSHPAAPSVPTSPGPPPPVDPNRLTNAEAQKYVSYVALNCHIYFHSFISLILSWITLMTPEWIHRIGVICYIYILSWNLFIHSLPVVIIGIHDIKLFMIFIDIKQFSQTDKCGHW